MGKTKMAEHKFNKAMLEKIGALAAVDLSEDEQNQLAGDLAAIIAYFERLQDVDTEGVDPTSHPMRIECPLRKDSDKDKGPINMEEARGSFPRKDGEFFIVPKKK